MGLYTPDVDSREKQSAKSSKDYILQISTPLKKAHTSFVRNNLWNFTSFHKFCFLVFHFLSSFFYNISTVSDACVLPLTYETSFIQLTQTSHLVFLALFIISFYLGFHSTSWNYLSRVSVLWRHFNHSVCSNLQNSNSSKITTSRNILTRPLYRWRQLRSLELDSALN